MDRHKKVSHVCDECGKTHLTRPYLLKRGRGRFCSNSCALRFRGRNDPRLKTARARAARRFWPRVEKTDACWLWLTSKDGDGYGHFMMGACRVKAHRFAYELLVGPIPDGLCVLHRCDNPSCVRPEHLFLGTVADNNRDARRKGRCPVRRGVAVPTAKLSEEQVREILRLHETGLGCKRLARMFRVSSPTIQRINRGDGWKHLHTFPVVE